MSYTYERATEATLPLFSKLRAKLFRTFVDNVDEAELAKNDADFFLPALKANQAEIWLVYDKQGQPAACGSVFFYRLSPKPWCPSGLHAYINSIWTEPVHRRQGLATEIMARCKAFAKNNGADYITLHATESGMPVYERDGFYRTTEMRMQAGQSCGTSKAPGDK